MVNNNSVIKTEISPEEYDMVMMSFDYIRYNRNITNERLPDLLLKFWSIPDFGVKSTYTTTDSQVLIFMFILKFYFGSSEEIEKALNTFQFSQLFYRFQVILATTAYSRKYHIPIRPFKLFDVKAYILPQLEKPSQLIKEYKRITKPHIKEEKKLKITDTSVR